MEVRMTKDGMYQKPFEFPWREWDKTLYTQYNWCLWSKKYMNEEWRRRLDERIAEILELINNGELFCPAEYKKKYKIFEFKHKGREFVQLELF